MRSMEELIQALPKVELHLHIEGTLEPEHQFRLLLQRGKNNTPSSSSTSIPTTIKTVEEIRAQYEKHFTCLEDFLNIYYQGCRLLQTENDFYELTCSYLQKCVEQNILHAEIFVDPQSHEHQLSLEKIMNGMTRACTEYQEEQGVSTYIIVCILRHLSAESAMETLEATLEYMDKYADTHRIVALGLDSSELNHPPGKFREVFARAKLDAKLKVCAHAGEEGPPSYVSGALNDLHADRIDHGIRSVEDPKLIQRLQKQQIPITVCPLSNVQLCTVPSLDEHPLQTMLVDHKLNVSLHSDDPAYFGGYINENYIQTAKALSLTKAQVVQLVQNGVRGSFLPEDAKEKINQDIDRVVELFPNLS